MTTVLCPVLLLATQRSPPASNAIPIGPTIEPAVALRVTVGVGLPLAANWSVANSTMVPAFAFATHRLLLKSKARPRGPSRDPADAAMVTAGVGVPPAANWLAENSTTVLAAALATHRLPLPLKAIPAGWLKEPAFAPSVTAAVAGEIGGRQLTDGVFYDAITVRERDPEIAVDVKRNAKGPGIASPERGC